MTKVQCYAKIGEELICENGDFIEDYYKLTAESKQQVTNFIVTKDALSQKIWQTFRANSPRAYRRMANSMIRHRLEKILNEAKLGVLPSQIKLTVEGSWASGLSNQDSFLDLSLETNSEPMKVASESIAAAILGHFRKLFTDIPKPRLVNFKFMTPLDLRLSYLDIPVAVNLRINSGQTSRSNDQLLTHYAKVDRRFVILSLVLNMWKRKVLDKTEDCKLLSGYALTLMLIQYLQAGCNPPVLPCIHKMYSDKVRPKSATDQLDSFKVDYRSSNNQSLADLLTGFFQYYSAGEEKGINLATHYVSVRHGKPVKKSSLYTMPLLRVVDPFTLLDVVPDPTVLVGSTTIDQLIDARIAGLNKYRKLFQCFSKAYENLNQKHDLSQIFE